MIAIATKFIKATDTRGSGIRASIQGKSVFSPYDHSLSGYENHNLAAIKLAAELDYAGRFFRMDNPSSKVGWLYVCTDEYSGRSPTFTIGKAMTAAQHLAAA
jgi:hypothetical protein